MFNSACNSPSLLSRLCLPLDPKNNQDTVLEDNIINTVYSNTNVSHTFSPVEPSKPGIPGGPRGPSAPLLPGVPGKPGFP